MVWVGAEEEESARGERVARSPLSIATIVPSQCFWYMASILDLRSALPLLRGRLDGVPQ